MATPAFYTGQMVISVKNGETETKLAYATSASLSMSTDTIDTSSKMDGSWATQYPGKRSWSCSSDGLLVPASGKALIEAWKAGELIEITFKGNTVTTSETDGTTTMAEDSNASMIDVKGSGLITSLEMTSDAGDIAKFSISVDGSGPLTFVTAS